MAKYKAKKKTQSAENSIGSMIITFAGLGYLYVVVMGWREFLRESTGSNFAFCLFLSSPILIALLVLIIRKAIRNRRQQVPFDSMNTGLGVPCIKIDDLTGLQFENFCASLLQRNGYVNVRVTQASGDFGADIVAYDRNGNKWVFQCKRYKNNLGNTPIQEVVAAKLHYGARYAGVMTNSHFTTAAKQLARENGVVLIEREQLFAMNRAGAAPKTVKKSSPARASTVEGKVDKRAAAEEKRQLNWIDEIEAIDAALDDN